MLNTSNKTPLVSIAMAVRNEEKYLLECLQSIASQTYKNWELIIVNDGSTDSTEEIIESFAQNSSNRIECINVESFGTPKCVNIAFRQATGKYVARMDGDDIMLPERLAKQVEFMENNPEIGVSGGNAVVIDEKGKKYAILKRPMENNDLKEIVKKPDYPFIQPAAIIRKELLKEVKYREHFPAPEDLYFWHDLSFRTKFANLDEFLILKRRPLNRYFSPEWKRSFNYYQLNLVLENHLKSGNWMRAFLVLCKQLWALTAPDFIYKRTIVKGKKNWERENVLPLDENA